MKILVFATLQAIGLGAETTHAQAMRTDVVVIDDAANKEPTLEAFEKHLLTNISNDLEHLSAFLAESLILIRHNYGHRSIAPPDGRCVLDACTDTRTGRCPSRESRHPP